MARSPREPLHIHEQDLALIHLDPPALSEISQRLVDRLARSTDELCQLFLGQVMVHQHAVRPRLAQLVGKVQELRGHPPRHIGEDEVGECLIGTT